MAVKIYKIKRGKMKDNTKFSGEFLKGPKKNVKIVVLVYQFPEIYLINHVN